MDLAGLAAILAAMGVFLWRLVKVFLGFVEKQQARQETFLSNHMSANTHAMERVADRLEALEFEARRAHEQAGRRA